MPIYNKLVRDRIAEIIANDGKECTTRVLDDQEFEIELVKKLQEEATELEKAQKHQGKIEELVDILEVLHSLTSFYDTTIDEIEKKRMEKRSKRGGFDKRIFLISVED